MELKEKLKDQVALIVEDDESVGGLAVRALTIFGFKKVDLAEDEERALELLNLNQYQFIVSDTNYGSPAAKDHFGPRIVATARKLGQSPKVIATSGLDNNRELWIGESKPDSFLTKPFSLKDFKEAIEKLYQV